MNRIAFCVFLVPLVFLISGPADAAEDALPNIIPKPSELEVRDGGFRFRPDTRILIGEDSPGAAKAAAYLADLFTVPAGYVLSAEMMPGNEPPSNSVYLALSNNFGAGRDEGYELTVSKTSVLLRAATPCGLFRGVQTIRQLLPVHIESDCFVQKDVDWAIPALYIRDYPEFSWRGLMLDCSRTFLTTEYLKRYIDLAAYYKMNRLHLHLTDDQGWRIEVQRYPKLTQIGAWGVKRDGKETGGFYTQEEIRELVAYAESRHVMLVPEIELPGHSVAAVAAYPELSCRADMYSVLTLPVTGLYKEGSLCAGKEFTFEFLEHVLSEVAALFPAPYIHVGGDECVKDHWKECPDCRKRMANERLKDEDELQSYFIRRIEVFLNSIHKRLIGWDEILEGGLAPNATVMSWRGITGAIESARTGHDAVMSPTSHCYLDYTHERISLEKAYSFNPIPSELSGDEAQHILGVQGNMWTHLATLEPQIDAQIFPRIIAIAEVGWTQKEKKDWKDFTRRMRNHYQRLDLLRVNYYKYIDYTFF